MRLGEQIVRGQIARAEQVGQILLSARHLFTPVDHQPIRHPAALRALAAVRAPVLERLARQALAGPAHAQGSVDEAFELEIGALREEADFLDGELAGQDDARHPELFGDPGGLGARHRHLGGSVQWKPGTDGVREPRCSEVLHEDGVRAGPGDGDERLLGDRKLPVEDQGVEGDEALDALAMEEVEDPGKVLDREVVRPGACVEPAAEPEVHGVRTRGDRGAEALLFSGRSEELGSDEALRHGAAP